MDILKKPPSRQRWQKGCDSCRIIVMLLDGKGELVEYLFTEEDVGGKRVLRIPGGKRYSGESVQDCASRELREETGIYRIDRRNNLIKAFETKSGSGESRHITHVYVCALTEKPKQVEVEDKNVHSLVWVSAKKMYAIPDEFVGPKGLYLQNNHHDYLLEFAKRRDLLEEVRRQCAFQDA